MIKKNKRNLYRHEIVSQLEGDTAKDVLDLLFGHYDNDYRSDYIIKERYVAPTKRNILRRINVLWFIPLFWLCAPFCYLLFGKYQINEDSKLGKVVTWLIGDLFSHNANYLPITLDYLKP